MVQNDHYIVFLDRLRQLSATSNFDQIIGMTKGKIFPHWHPPLRENLWLLSIRNMAISSDSGYHTDSNEGILCWHATVQGMSLRKVTSLSSNLASVTDIKEFRLHTVYAVILKAKKPLQLVGQVAQFKV